MHQHQAARCLGEPIHRNPIHKTGHTRKQNINMGGGQFMKRAVHECGAISGLCRDSIGPIFLELAGFAIWGVPCIAGFVV